MISQRIFDMLYRTLFLIGSDTSKSGWHKWYG